MLAAACEMPQDYPSRCAPDGLGLGAVAHMLVALACHPHEAVARELHSIRVAVEIAFGRFGQTLRQRQTVE